MSTAEQRVAAMHRKATTVEIVIDPATGDFVLRPEGDGTTTVEAGRWAEMPEGKRSVRVSLAYEASAYFDLLVSRQRAEDRAIQLRAFVAVIERSKSIAEVRQVARAALNGPLELAVKREIDERREAEERRRAEHEAPEEGA
jgi:hypothetical protein